MPGTVTYLVLKIIVNHGTVMPIFRDENFIIDSFKKVSFLTFCQSVIDSIVNIILIPAPN